MPFDALVKVADRIINIVERRQIDRQKLFQDIIDPLFKELEPAASDCFSLFRFARDQIQKEYNPDHSLKLVKELRKQRENNHATRVKIRAMADVIRNEVDEKDVVQFADDVVNYFYCTERDIVQDVLHTIPMSVPARLVDLAQSPFALESLRKFIEDQLSEMELKWSGICEGYTKLKVKLVNPSRFNK